MNLWQLLHLASQVAMLLFVAILVAPLGYLVFLGVQKIKNLNARPEAEQPHGE
ncbi:hypothetical protein [Actinoalloteichus hymeniacidonis]|uniref:Uncharacterized protein n=1 Tax=Actinoalloteichus hymeniacidonis TaxID=340345 RepID=A0AAC9HWH2_9PSEU|nr:hypothetical protein [Actinoalloteichus hymeniacidonis]AOS65750.1 hypothetical protein TL08_24860 [Actinoalloteichus hymeniacidonis]MBB5906160.1 hypothetical protein [Actinoalloteichus hymeniacidonis]